MLGDWKNNFKKGGGELKLANNHYVANSFSKWPFSNWITAYSNHKTQFKTPKNFGGEYFAFKFQYPYMTIAFNNFRLPKNAVCRFFLLQIYNIGTFCSLFINIKIWRKGALNAQKW